MALDTLKQLNWLDIFVIIILIRIGYISLRNDLPTEFFKLLGTIMAIYLSLHYYTALSDALLGRLSLFKEKMPLEFMDFIFLVSLVAGGYAIFVVLRHTLYRFIRIDAGEQLNKWGGLALSMVRGFYLSSLIIFILVVSGITYFKNSVINSYSGIRLFKLAPGTYVRLWDGLMSKIMTKEKFNRTVLEVEDSLTQR